MEPSINKVNLNQVPNNIIGKFYQTTTLLQGKRKARQNQRFSMSCQTYFMGRTLLQIILVLAQASYSFKELYDTTTDSVVDKDSLSSNTVFIKRYTLTSSLSLNNSRVYTTRIEITALDHEKKYSSNKQLTTSGRQILN